MAELSIRGVNKFYKLGNKSTFQALNDINLDFENGELVSIIGESGSGKSTLMNIIGGLDSDYEGDIVVGGESLKGLKDKDSYRKNKIGFVFQSFNLIPHLTILDNVTIALTLSNVSGAEKEKKAIEVLKKLGLEKHLKKKPNQLSGGQKQRVAIARALINDPEIILADEPTGALDSDTSKQILGILKKIADEGKLVIMVTHSEKIAKISSRIVEISDGKVIIDKKNEKYKKGDVAVEAKEKKEKKNGNLSLFQAIRLSFHNMWASKTKNFLMAFGVSISLVSLILMLSLGAGLTGYISDLSNSFSSPEIVSVTKTSKIPFGQYLNPGTFTTDEILKIKDEINENISSKTNFQVETITNGWQQMYENSISFTTKDGKEIKEDIFFSYTTPPYYTDKNLVAGTLSGEENEIMLSSNIVSLLGVKDYEEVFNTPITLNLNFKNEDVKATLTNVKITAIVDSNMFSDTLIMYANYNFFNNIVKHASDQEKELLPTSLYIKTDGIETTKLINDYIKTREDLAGSLEESMLNMFSEMMSTFSIAMVIISIISLTVATIMILTVLYMSVSERTREIGTLKSIGARKRDIKTIFSTESFLIGLLSGLVGIALSLLIGGIIKLILTALLGFAPIAFVWYYYFIALGVSIFISVLAGLYPASKAAKLDPVESLRHE